MGMIVQHNMNALNAYNKLNTNVAGLKRSSEKLSSGYRINRAGDDAAGLAISEKMRSQIRGLNQAKRNAQDGISMIQTFEGAAQETHSILQRMKELASESANGTYDNMTDRAAIQLEFDQLNDELNQIADTDFNGTVVLNGGVMADGLKAENGEFDYANKKEQLTDTVTGMLDDAIAAAKAKVNEADKALSGKADKSSNGDAIQWNTVDNSAYDKTAADNLWKDLGLTKKDAAGTGEVADVSKGDTVNITFEYDGSTWVAKKGTVSGGKLEGEKALTKSQLEGATITVEKSTLTDANGDGGFKVKSKTNTTAGTLGNAVFDAINPVKGDTVTLTYTNADKTTYAPNNIGFDENTKKLEGGTALTLTATLGGVKDEDMNAVIKKAFDNIENAAFKATYADDGSKLESVTFAGESLTIDNQTTNQKQEITIGETTYQVDFGGAPDAASSMIVKVKSSDTAADYDTTLFTIGFAAGADDTTTGFVEGTISISESRYADASGITITPGDDPALEDNSGLVDAKNKAQAELDAAVAKKAKVLTGDDKQWENVKNYFGVEKGVSIADSFDNSTARMTYTDNITLQTGARTKDSVNFTFNYNTDDTADMGELKANLNLSARADGLNTENLSLATAKDANYAIDQIDKAINKTSMVRASFGAIQNRLEHKIDNLTVTSENLTEAEAGIRDTDMASEMMNYTKFNILQQAAQSMLAQANQQPQSILQLLG